MTDCSWKARPAPKSPDEVIRLDDFGPGRGWSFGLGRLGGSNSFFWSCIRSPLTILESLPLTIVPKDCRLGGEHEFFIVVCRRVE